MIQNTEGSKARLKRVARIVLFGALYYAAARIGLRFSFGQSPASPVWPAAGVAFAGVLLLGPHVWPAMWFGAFAANAIIFFSAAAAPSWTSLWVCALIASGNTIEALLGRFLCHRWSAQSEALQCEYPWFPEFNVFRFATVALLAGLFSACMGATAICAAGLEPWSHYSLVWLIWWSGDASGILLVTPCLLSWAQPWRIQTSAAFWSEIVAAFGLLALACYAIFANTLIMPPYLTIPPLVWIAARLGPRALASGLLFLAAWGIWHTSHGRGPFAGPSEFATFLHLLVFLWVVGLTSMALVGTVTALQKVTAELEQRVEARTAELQAANQALKFESAKCARAADEAHLNYQRYQLLAANFPNGVVTLFDHNLRYIVADGMMLKPIGLSKEFMEGKTIWETLPAETVQTVEPHYRAALAGVSDLFELPFADRDVLCYTLPVRDAHGRIFAGMGMAQDITAQKQAEAALRKERDFSAAVLDTVAALVIVLDCEGRIIEFNHACEETSGQTFEEVRGKSFWDLALLIPEESDGVKRTFSELLAGQLPSRLENHWVAQKERRLSLIAWSNTVVFAPDGSIQYLVGTGIDITEQRQAEEALRRGEKRFRVAVDHFPGTFTIYDAQKRVQFVNQRGLELLGRAEQELLGHTNEELFPPEITATYMRALDRCAESCLRQTVEATLPLRGHEVTLIIDFVPLMDEHGEISQILEIAYDISERKRSEEELQQSEARFSAFMNNLPGLASMKDREGRYIYVNGQVLEIFCKKLNELIGKTVDDFCPPTLAAEVRAKDQRVLEEGRSIQSVEVIEFEEQPRHWLVNQFPVRDKTGALLVGSIRIEITERVVAEQKLKAALEKEVALRREIHHRVKNNLQVIISLLYLQSSQISDPTLLDILREAQTRIHSIAVTHEMLSQSKDLNKIEVTEYIRRLTAHLVTTYPTLSKKVTLSVHVERIFLGMDTALPCGLIMIELLSNAFKHAFPGAQEGEIAIDCQSADTGRLVQLTVRDNGVGLPEGFDVTHSPAMGLKLVRDLTQQLGGSVEFRREHGTVITIVFTNADQPERI